MPSTVLVILQENSGELFDLPNSVPQIIRDGLQGVVNAGVDWIAERFEETLVAVQSVAAYDSFVSLTDDACKRDRLLDELVKHSLNNDTIDLLVFGHGSPGTLYLKDETLTGGTVRSLSADAMGMGCNSLNLRMVYMCNCHAASMVDAWLAIGAKTAVGAQGINWIPEPMSGWFLRLWLDGDPIASVADRAHFRSTLAWRFWPEYWPIVEVSLWPPDIRTRTNPLYSDRMGTSQLVVGGDADLTSRFVYDPATRPNTGRLSTVPNPPLPVPPVLELAPAVNVAAGHELLLTGRISDPEPNDTHRTWWIWSSDDPPSEGAVSAVQGQANVWWVSGSHTWGRHGQAAITLIVADVNGLEARASTVVTITNVVPSVGPLDLPDRAWPGKAIVARTSFSDPGWLETHTAVVDWGDGTSEPGSLNQTHQPPLGEGTVSGSHHFAVPGNFQVSVMVTDDGGASNSAVSTIHIELSPDMPGIVKTDIQLTFLTWVRSLPGAMGAAEFAWRNGAGVPKLWWLYEADGWLFLFQKTANDVVNYVSSRPTNINGNFLAISVPRSDFKSWFWGRDADDVGAWIPERIAESRDHIFRILRQLYG